MYHLEVLPSSLELLLRLLKSKSGNSKGAKAGNCLNFPNSGLNSEQGLITNGDVIEESDINFRLSISDITSHKLFFPERLSTEINIIIY